MIISQLTIERAQNKKHRSFQTKGYISEFLQRCFYIYYIPIIISVGYISYTASLYLNLHVNRNTCHYFVKKESSQKCRVISLKC